VKKSV